MVLDQNIAEALDVRKLDLPSQPEVLSLEAEPYVDWTGEDSLRVWVILSDETDEERFNGDDLLKIDAAIHDSLLARGVTLFPYTRFVKKGERNLMGNGAAN